MMTKKQKTWLWIFIAMFAIPELVWGPTFGYTSFIKNIFDANYRVELLVVLFLQFLGEILFLIYFIKNSKTHKNISYWSVILIAILIILKSFSVFYILFATYGMWS